MSYQPQKYKKLVISPRSTAISYDDPTINPIFFPFDFLLLLDNPQGTNIYIKIDDYNSDEIPLTRIRLIKNPQGTYSKFWIRTDNAFTTPIVIYLGGDANFETQYSQAVQLIDAYGQSINLLTDSNRNLYVDLNAENIGMTSHLSYLDSIYNTMTSTLTFSTLNVNVGTTATPITSTSTLVSMILIQNNGTVDVYLGTSTLQNIKIPAGGSMSLVAPLGKKFDLNKLYLYASSSTTIGVLYA
jgi:hypothetical protein